MLGSFENFNENIFRVYVGKFGNLFLSGIYNFWPFSLFYSFFEHIKRPSFGPILKDR